MLQRPGKAQINAHASHFTSLNKNVLYAINVQGISAHMDKEMS